MATKLGLRQGGTGADNALTASQNLDLEKGVDVQAYSANLAALAGLTSAANKVLMYSGEETASLLDFNPSSAITASTTTLSSNSAIINYVTAQISGLDLKDPVHAAIDSNIDISTDLVNGASLGGVTVVTGRRYFLTGQTDASQNGIYVAVAAGAASRATDADADSKVSYGMQSRVISGTHSGQMVTLVTTGAITLDTTNLSFAITTNSTYSAGESLSLSGTEFLVTDAGITAAKLATDSVTTAKIADSAVTLAKVEDVDQYTILARSTAGAGVVEKFASTSYSFSLLALADAAAGRSALGIKTNVTGEVPSGTINGVNVTFTLANTPESGSEAGYLNGARQQSGVGHDYTITGDTITMDSAPLTGEDLLFDYRY